MAFLMIMEWPQVTREQYEAVRADVDWVGNPPPGGLLHVASFSEGGFRVVDLWDSPEQFQSFVASRLQAATEKAGVTTQPTVNFYPANYIDQLGIRAMA